MARDKSDFFESKSAHPWSKTKDSLLGCYLKPFFDKTYRASADGYIYVDAFAGPGMYTDGSVGSPILAMQQLLATARHNPKKHAVQFIFGEADEESRAELKETADKTAGKVRYILPVCICESSTDALNLARKMQPCRNRRPATIFYYVDPYGVKDLKPELLCQSPNLKHTEALVNFNTVGFMRDGYDALRIACELPKGVKVIDQPFDDNVPMTERIERLNACIGSDEWQQILRDKSLSYWERERQIGRLFCNNARKCYSYVTNMAIRDMDHMINEGGEIKYRLIHMTNNVDGCLLMNDDMLKRNNDEQVRQGMLFKVDIDRQEVDPSAIHRYLSDSIAKMPEGRSVKMGVFAAAVINKYGVFDKSNALLKTYLKPFLDDGTLVREQPCTATGRACTSFDPKKTVKKA